MTPLAIDAPSLAYTVAGVEAYVPGVGPPLELLAGWPLTILFTPLPYVRICLIGFAHEIAPGVCGPDGFQVTASAESPDPQESKPEMFGAITKSLYAGLNSVAPWPLTRYYSPPLGLGFVWLVNWSC